MTLRILLLAIAASLFTAAGLHSQSPAPAPRTPQQTLQAIKMQNQKLLEQQAATLQKLEEMHKAAQQLRILARRT
jgi:hypothetical protein